MSVLTQRVGAGEGTWLGNGDIEGLGVGAYVGNRVEEPPPHAQHTAVAVKSSSSYMPHEFGLES